MNLPTFAKLLAAFGVVRAQRNVVTGGIKSFNGFRTRTFDAYGYYSGEVLSSPSSQVVGDYTLTGAGSTMAINADVKRDGRNTLRVDLNRETANGSTEIKVTHAIPAVIDSTGRFGVWVYVPDYTALNQITLGVSHGSTNYANGVYQAYNISSDSDKKFNGWHFVAFDLAEWGGAYGTPNWSAAIGAVKITFYQASTAPAVVHVDQFVCAWARRARLMIIADDGNSSWFDRGIPVLDSLGLKSTSAIIGALVGSGPDYTTWEKIRAAYDNGHDMCPHGEVSLATLADAAIPLDVGANIAHLTSRGLNRGIGYYCYPLGVYQKSAGDQTIINALKQNGIKAARTTSNVRQMKVQGNSVGDARYVMPTLGVSASTTSANVISYLNALAASGAVGTIMYHKIVTSGATGGEQRNLADFLAEMTHVRDLVAAGKLCDVTASEFIETQGIA